MDTAFDDEFDRYRCFVHGGSIYAAIKILGALHNCVDRLDPILRKTWIKRIQGEKLNRDYVANVMFNLQKEINGLRSYLADSHNLIYEEMVYFLTKRIEIDLVIEVMIEMENIESRPVLADIDDQFLQIIENDFAIRRTFESAATAIAKNWGLPISNKWLPDFIDNFGS